jgi:hypothetical protein
MTIAWWIAALLIGVLIAWFLIKVAIGKAAPPEISSKHLLKQRACPLRRGHEQAF